MNRLAQWLLRLYPSTWRRRYGNELQALVDDTGADVRVIAGLLKGAVRMQFSTWSFPRLAAVLGLAGTLIGASVILLTPTNYTASTVLPIIGADSPVVMFDEVKKPMTSRAGLSSIINDPRILLYRDQLLIAPLEDVIDHMRTDLSIELVGENTEKPAMNISFTYPDKSKAQKSIQGLAAVAARISNDIASEARPDTERILWVTETANLPDRPLPATAGVEVSFVAAGALVGLLSSLLWRRFAKRDRKRPVMFAITGAAAGLAMALLLPEIAGMIPDDTIPLRYQSHATMYMENASEVPPSILIAQVFNRQSLSSVIGDPSLQLYPDRLRSHDSGELADAMRRDVVISSRNAGPNGRWIDISFTYPDPAKAQKAVTHLISRVEYTYQCCTPKPEATASRTPHRGSLGTGEPPAITVDTAKQYSTSPMLIGLIAGLLFAGILATVRHKWEAEPENGEPFPLQSNLARFRKLAVWLTAALALAGAVYAWRVPALYTSDATVSFENVPLQRAWQLIAEATTRKLPNLTTQSEEIVRHRLTWSRSSEPDAKFVVIKMQFASPSPEFARQFLRDLLFEIDHQLELEEQADWRYNSGQNPNGASPRMKMIDAPQLPEESQGLGWMAVAVGASAGLLLAALLSFLTASRPRVGRSIIMES